MLLACLLLVDVLGISPNCFSRLLRSKKSKVLDTWLKVWLFVLRWLAETIGIGPWRAICPLLDPEFVLLVVSPADFYYVLFLLELFAVCELVLVLWVGVAIPNCCSNRLKSTNPLESTFDVRFSGGLLLLVVVAAADILLFAGAIALFYRFLGSLLSVTELFLLIYSCICLRSLCVMFKDRSNYVMLILLNVVLVPLGTTCPSTIPSKQIMKETMNIALKDNSTILYYIIFSESSKHLTNITHPSSSIYTSL